MNVISLVTQFLKRQGFVLLILSQLLWTFVVVHWIKEVTFDSSNVFNVLTATLGFILPLRLNTALKKNRKGLKVYNAFCGDLLSLAWHSVAIVPVEKVTPQKGIINPDLQKIFKIITILPEVVKHHFRGDLNWNEVKYKGNPIVWASIGMGKQQTIPILYCKLVDYINDYSGDDKTLQRELLIKWQRIYASWGDLDSLCTYRPPTLFNNVLVSALILWSIMLPFSVIEQEYHAIWMVFIISYFFLGLNISGQKIGNAFAEGDTGFATVSDSQKEQTRLIEDVNKRKVQIASRDVEFPLPEPQTNYEAEYRLKFL